MSDQEPKRWELTKGELAIESGIDLLTKRAEYGVGEGVLQVGWDKFAVDEDGEAEDVDVRKVARAFFTARYGGDLTDQDIRAGVAGTDHRICDHHKDMVKQLCETGEYTPNPVKAATLADKFKFVKKLAAKKGKKKKDDELVAE